jgi:hypothetical protein
LRFLCEFAETRDGLLAIKFAGSDFQHELLLGIAVRCGLDAVCPQKDNRRSHRRVPIWHTMFYASFLQVGHVVADDLLSSLGTGEH